MAMGFESRTLGATGPRSLRMLCSSSLSVDLHTPHCFKHLTPAFSVWVWRGLTCIKFISLLRHMKLMSMLRFLPGQ